MPAAAVEEAFERGMNYLYWGSLRRKGFADGVRNLRRERDRMVLVVQSYSRMARALRWSVEGALHRLGMEYTDVLLLGWWNRPVSGRILEASLELRSRGLVRHLAISTHHRPVAAVMANNEALDVLHIRYNAVHRGAEADVFPYLSPSGRPGIVSYTATNWGQLMDPKRTPPGERTPTAGDCYRFVLSNPSVDVCMTGVSTVEQMRHALSALERGPLDLDEKAWMERVGAFRRKQPQG
jgi:aryl-alcohol dehydrogenase-like predicted oxidoreductase